jgi:hypothetical protein
MKFGAPISDRETPRGATALQRSTQDDNHPIIFSCFCTGIIVMRSGDNVEDIDEKEFWRGFKAGSVLLFVILLIEVTLLRGFNY